MNFAKYYEDKLRESQEQGVEKQDSSFTYYTGSLLHTIPMVESENENHKAFMPLSSNDFANFSGEFVLSKPSSDKEYKEGVRNFSIMHKSSLIPEEGDEENKKPHFEAESHFPSEERVEKCHYNDNKKPDEFDISIGSDFDQLRSLNSPRSLEEYLNIKKKELGKDESQLEISPLKKKHSTTSNMDVDISSISSRIVLEAGSSEDQELKTQKDNLPPKEDAVMESLLNFNSRDNHPLTSLENAGFFCKQPSNQEDYYNHRQNQLNSNDNFLENGVLTGSVSVNPKIFNNLVSGTSTSNSLMITDTAKKENPGGALTRIIEEEDESVGLGSNSQHGKDCSPTFKLNSAENNLRSLEKINEDNIKNDLFKKVSLKNFDEQVLSSLTCYESVSPKLERTHQFTSMLGTVLAADKKKEAKMLANLDMPRSIKASPLRDPANDPRLKELEQVAFNAMIDATVFPGKSPRGTASKPKPEPSNQEPTTASFLTNKKASIIAEPPSEKKALEILPVPQQRAPVPNYSVTLSPYRNSSKPEITKKTVHEADINNKSFNNGSSLKHISSSPQLSSPYVEQDSKRVKFSPLLRSPADNLSSMLVPNNYNIERKTVVDWEPGLRESSNTVAFDKDISSKKENKIKKIKELAMRVEINFQRKQEEKIKDDLLTLKQKAVEKSKIFDRRKKAVIFIQKIFRGFVLRKKFSHMKAKLERQRETRYLRMIRLEKTRQRAIELICREIYKYIQRKRKHKQQVVIKFLNHCATLIQKFVRGYLHRKKHKIVLDRINRFRSLLKATILGWKTRRLLKSKKIARIKEEISHLERLNQKAKKESLSPKLSSGLKGYDVGKMKDKLILTLSYELRKNNWLSREQDRAVGGNQNYDQPNRRPSSPLITKTGYVSGDGGRPIHHETEKKKFKSQQPSLALQEQNYFDNVPIRPNNVVSKQLEEEPDNDKMNFESSGKKHQFLKRKNKYDPVKSIESAKKGKIPAQIKAPTDSENLKGKETEEEDEDAIFETRCRLFQEGKLDEEDLKNEPRFNFLKRKSKTIHFQKLDWKSVKPKTDCWGNKSNNASNTTLITEPIQKRDKIAHSPHKSNPQASKKGNDKSDGKSSKANSGEKSLTLKRLNQNLKHNPSSEIKSAAFSPNPVDDQRKPRVTVEDLESVYIQNYKLKHKEIESSIKDFMRFEEKLKSFIPRIKATSTFVKNYSPHLFPTLLRELEDHHQKLKTLT